MDSLQGHFLVASPHLPDGNFYRSVVLVVEHNDDGAFGLILNRPTTKTVREVWEMIGEDPCGCADPVYLGGPVEGPLLALHRYHEGREAEVLPGLFLTSQTDHVIRIVEDAEPPFRLFSGYAGWAPGQLEGELDMGGWLTVKADPELIFADADDLWKRVTEQIGLTILGPTIGRNSVPQDPSCN